MIRDMYLPDETDQDAVPGDVPGPVAREVDVRGDYATAVASHDLHSNTGSSLKTPADVATVPSKS